MSDPKEVTSLNADDLNADELDEQALEEAAGGVVCSTYSGSSDPTCSTYSAPPDPACEFFTYCSTYRGPGFV
jgi:hypothetical protein